MHGRLRAGKGRPGGVRFMRRSTRAIAPRGRVSASKRMSEHRPRLGRVPFGTAAAAVAVYGMFVRPRLLSWGATHDEAVRGYPGDELVPDAGTSSTMATTLPAPPEQVWPWLLQMGCNRASWYAWDRLDTGGQPSMDRVDTRYGYGLWGSTPRRPPTSSCAICAVRGRGWRPPRLSGGSSSTVATSCAGAAAGGGPVSWHASSRTPSPCCCGPLRCCWSR